MTPQQYARVRAEAERALRAANALGRFPTPVDAVLRAAKVKEVEEDVLNEGFVAKLRAQASGLLKSALSKVIGLFDAKSSLVFIDRTIHVVKQTFVRLHEAGHAFLPWQRGVYALVEDCDQSIDPMIADEFDREANVFATEILFQLDNFSTEAEEHEFSVLTPVRLSKSYGSSIYAAMRRYVSKNWRACTVVVLNPPELIPGDGFRATLRRHVASESFTQLFGEMDWPDSFTPDDDIGRMVPLGNRKMSGKRSMSLVDRNGTLRECMAEAFTQSHQVFVLIVEVKSLSRSIFLSTDGPKR